MVDWTSSLRTYRAVGRCRKFIVLCGHVTMTMAAIVHGSLTTSLECTMVAVIVRRAPTSYKAKHVNSAFLFISLSTFTRDLVSPSLHFLYELRCQDTSRFFRSPSQPLLLQTTYRYIIHCDAYSRK
jgi:hypothetical protein